MTSVCVASSKERPLTSKISSPTSKSALSAGDPEMTKAAYNHTITVNDLSFWAISIIIYVAPKTIHKYKAYLSYIQLRKIRLKFLLEHDSIMLY